MAFFKLVKQKLCTHEWHRIGREGSLIVGIYCPKCEKEEHVAEERWEELKEIEKVRKSYRQGQHH